MTKLSSVLPCPADWTPEDYYSYEHSSPDEGPRVVPTSPENPDWYYADDGGCHMERETLTEGTYV